MPAKNYGGKYGKYDAHTGVRRRGTLADLDGLQLLACGLDGAHRLHHRLAGAVSAARPAE
eukprot:941725-Prorocentrum_minimum.AAC.2